MDIREIAIQWLSKAKEIEAGESIFVPVTDKKARKRFLKVFEKELRVMAEIDPVAAASITIGGLLKDGQHWITVTRKKSTPLIGWVKNDQGQLTRVEITVDTEKQRRLRLMVIDDRMLDPEIAATEGEMTEEDWDYVAKLRRECGL